MTTRILCLSVVLVCALWGMTSTFVGSFNDDKHTTLMAQISILVSIIVALVMGFIFYRSMIWQ